MELLLGNMSFEEVREICGGGAPSVVIVPIGSVEPHGPHLPLATDAIISQEASSRAAAMLRARGIATAIAPSVPYGVTDFAEGFAGAAGVPAKVLADFLGAIVKRFLSDGWRHVCLVNNHLEPAHDAAVRASIANFPPGTASVACPLTRRWARTLSEEFKRGECHAGRYETSLALAAGARVKPEHATLPRVPVSLSDGIKTGKRTFAEMGMERAYAGAPAEATAAEGEILYDLLAEMIVTEVVESLAGSRR
jgi:creatinine amidohydrolase